MSESGGRRTGVAVCRARSSGRRKRRKNKVRAAPFPSRFHHSLQARLGEPATGNPNSGTGETQASKAAQFRQLRREVMKTKGKPEKKTAKSENSSTAAHNPDSHHCEQWSFHKPKNKCNLQHLKSNSPQKMESIETHSELDNSSGPKSTKKPFSNSENVQNLKMKTEICRTDEKEINYAGAKFSDPPSPSVLPKPPSHWMGMNTLHSHQCKELMSYHLKTLLKVQL